MYSDSQKSSDTSIKHMYFACFGSLTVWSVTMIRSNKVDGNVDMVPELYIIKDNCIFWQFCGAGMGKYVNLFFSNLHTTKKPP